MQKASAATMKKEVSSASLARRQKLRIQSILNHLQPRFTVLPHGASSPPVHAAASALLTAHNTQLNNNNNNENQIITLALPHQHHAMLLEKTQDALVTLFKQHLIFNGKQINKQQLTARLNSAIAMMNHQKRPFNMIEILIAISISIALSVITGTVFAQRYEESRVSNAKLELTRIQDALVMYLVRNTRYPLELEELVSALNLILCFKYIIIANYFA